MAPADLQSGEQGEDVLRVRASSLHRLLRQPVQGRAFEYHIPQLSNQHPTDLLLCNGPQLRKFACQTCGRQALGPQSLSCKMKLADGRTLAPEAPT